MSLRRASTLAAAGAFVGALTSPLLTSPLSAQELTLRVADFYPVGHPTPEYSIQYWMDQVTERSDGRVAFEYFPAQQLGQATDLLDLSLSGVTDVAGYATSYVSDRMPLSSVAELPGAFGSSCAGTMAYWQLATEGPLQAEYEANDSRLLFVIVNPPFQLFLTDGPFTGPEAVEGLRIRTTGGAQEETIAALGGVPVRMAGPEIYEALARRTLDGVVFPVTSLFSYDLHEHVRFATAGESFGSGVLPYTMSLETWNGLSDEVQEIMVELGEETSRRACEMIDADIEPAVARLSEEGVEVVNPDGAGRTAFIAETNAVAERWATTLDERGLPGSEVLEAFASALAD
ncbi:MAG: TRAP transporter substrate-binding protein DctP [Azospirillaceae bacterium]